MTLAGVAERITQPMVVVFGKRDRLVPWQHAARLAQEAPERRSCGCSTRATTCA